MNIETDDGQEPIETCYCLHDVERCPAHNTKARLQRIIDNLLAASQELDFIEQLSPALEAAHINVAKALGCVMAEMNNRKHS